MNKDEEKMTSNESTSDRTNEGNVYKSTTIEYKDNDTGVLDKMKKLLHLGNSMDLTSMVGERKKQEFKRAETLNDKKITEMTEEAALLEHIDRGTVYDIELKKMQKNRSLSTAMRLVMRDCIEEMIETEFGSILVAIQGNRTKKAILTYHDFGLNYASNFQVFCNHPEMKELLENFCVYHVNAPGQHDGATMLPDDYEYLSMDDLAAQINYVLTHFKIKSFIGFGVGVGANILVRYALSNPDKVDLLCLINCVSTSASWIEWGYQKINTRSLKSKGMTQSVIDYLIWHHLGKGTDIRNPDLYHTYKNYFEKHVNHHNLSLFIDSYVKRTDLKLTREIDPAKRKASDTLQMTVLNITGALSPHVEDTVTLNGKLNPEKCSWMKISDCGMPLEEQPEKVVEAFRLLLQGSSYVIQVGRRLSTITVEKPH